MSEISNNSNFHLIASDGGLLSQPFQTNRVRLSTGERAEILVNFNNYTVGQQVYLKSYASELQKGIIGADSVGTSSIVMSEGYYGNPLNGSDFNILRFDVVPQTNNPVTTIPTTFAPKIPLLEANANAKRRIIFTPDTVTSGQQGKVDGPFLMNNTPFNIDSINIKTLLNNTEIWTLINKTLVAHPFHIHDIEFFVLDINGVSPPPQYMGLKDVILVQPGDSVRFITKFTTFADNAVPYMYHCHLLHHEDDGMMGTFLVQDPNTIGIIENESQVFSVKVFPNPSDDKVTFSVTNSSIKEITVLNMLGQVVYNAKNIDSDSHSVNLNNLNIGVYLVSVQTTDKSFKNKLIKK